MQISWSIHCVAPHLMYVRVYIIDVLKKLCVIFLTCCDTFEGAPTARADLDSPRVWNSAQPLQHLPSTCAAEGWAPCLQPWTDQCQLVWQEMGRINQFNSPRSLWFADRLSDLSFYGAESLQNQNPSLCHSLSHKCIISLTWIFTSKLIQLFFCLKLLSSFKFPELYGILFPLW